MNSLLQKIRYKGYTLIENVFFRHFSFFTKKNTLLLVRLDSIGDYILFRNFIQELKSSEKYKNYKITLCGNSWWKELAESLDASCIDQFIWIDYSKMLEEEYKFKLYKKIFLSGFETVISPVYSRDYNTDNLIKYSGAKYRIGYNGDTLNLSPEIKERYNAFYTQLITTPHQYRFEFYRNKDFFESVLHQPLALQKPSIPISKEEKNHILFFPGAKDAFRRWSPLNFAQLATRLTGAFPGLKLLICGSAGDSNMATEIINKAAVPMENLTGKYNLRQLLDVISAAKLIVGNDSGPFHLAVALNKNVICISNGNNYGKFTPYPEQMKTNSVVLYPQKILSYSEEERLRKFNKQVTDVDINEITVDEVFATITNHFRI